MLYVWPARHVPFAGVAGTTFVWPAAAGGDVGAGSAELPFDPGAVAVGAVTGTVVGAVVGFAVAPPDPPLVPPEPEPPLPLELPPPLEPDSGSEPVDEPAPQPARTADRSARGTMRDKRCKKIDLLSTLRIARHRAENGEMDFSGHDDRLDGRARELVKRVGVVASVGTCGKATPSPSESETHGSVVKPARAFVWPLR